MISASPAVKYGLHYWLAIALFSLFVANSLAIVLIALKVPALAITSAEPLFKPFLAYHVNLAMVFWMPAVACWVWCCLFELPKKLIRVTLALSVISLLLLLASLSDVEQMVSLSNYYPILHSDVFIAALGIQVLSVTINASLVLTKATNGDNKLFLAKAAAVAWLMFTLSVILNIASSSAVLVDTDYFEQLLWAPGHIQQIVNGFILASLWACFLNHSQESKSLRWFSYLALITTALALAISYTNIDAQLSRQAFTWQMSLFSWLPMAVVAFYLLKQKLNNSYLKLSLTVALLGVIAGLLILPGNLTVPGHYHGMTAAFNLAFFAILFSLVPVQKRYQTLLTRLYGTGLVLLIVGLTWAGRAGIGRKLVAEQQGVLNFSQSMALLMIVIGAGLAIIISLLIIKSFFPKLSYLFKINK